jgi:phage protein D
MAGQTIGQINIDPLGLNVSPIVNSVTLHQCDYNHDIAEVTVRNVDTSAPYLITGTPVIIKYGWLGAFDFFYGYIAHVGSKYRHALPQQSTFTDIVCIGASYSLKEGVANTWTNSQASTIVAQYANSAMFSGFIENDDPTWPSLSATNTSIWSFLVALAKKNGYTFSVNKTNFKYLSTDTALSQSVPSMPTFYGAATAGTAENITSFTAYQGETLGLDGHTKANRTTADINMATGTTFVTSQTAYGGGLGSNNPAPIFNQYPTNINGPDQVTTATALAGVTVANRFSLQSQAKVSGNVQVIQGTAAYFSGIGSTNSGAWYVQEAHHKITNSNYTMDLVLGRDAIGNNGLTPTQNANIVSALGSSFSQELNNIPQSVLVSGVWRAANQGIVNP